MAYGVLCTTLDTIIFPPDFVSTRTTVILKKIIGV